MEPEELFEEPDSSSDPERLKEKELSELQARLQQEADLRAVLATPEGRRFLVRIFDICGYNEEYLQPNHGLMAATAGRRQISRQVCDWIREVIPDGFSLWQLFDAEWQAYRYPPPVKKKR